MLRKTLTLISLRRPFSSIPSKTLTPHQKSSFESTLHHSLITHDTDQAWKVFRSFAAASSLPDKRLLNSLITHLSSFHNTDQNTSLRHRLKRAFVSTTYVIEKDPILLEFETVRTVLESMKLAKASGPALALVECMFKNRYFVPFDLWGDLLIDVCRENGSLAAFLKVFRESCRIAVDEKLDFMKPDLVASNAALEGDSNVTAIDNVTPNLFDNSIYHTLLRGEGLLNSDQEMYTSLFGIQTRRIVSKYAEDPVAFFEQFSKSMVKMGNILNSESLADGEVRRNCRFVNT